MWNRYHSKSTNENYRILFLLEWHLIYNRNQIIIYVDSFEILTESGSWVSAKAEITGKNTIAVTNGTDVPLGVRAGFKGFAEPMYNLYNSADLLATPFRLTK